MVHPGLVLKWSTIALKKKKNFSYAASESCSRVLYASRDVASGEPVKGAPLPHLWLIERFGKYDATPKVRERREYTPTDGHSSFFTSSLTSHRLCCEISLIFDVAELQLFVYKIISLMLDGF